jgi:HAD superfamily 5'-nucleotidase-like hydrolase
MKDWSDLAPFPPPPRRLWCNRTLNLRTIRVVGYDMDYTLIHYRVDEWERRAYEHLRQRLGDQGYPVEGLEFDPDGAIRGLAIDKERGNLVKANRFGYVKQAAHGTRAMTFDELRHEYGRTVVDLAEPRWEFLNTFFSKSEGCMYAQLVDRLDEKRLPGVMGYADLYRLVKKTLDFAHMEGHLKAEIIEAPERFVDLDPDLPQALEDQRLAGKKVLLITNSEWSYTKAMMAYAFDRFLPEGRTWRDLFDMVFVSARKPAFFTSRMPVFEVATEDGMLRPVTGLHDGALFLGGDARLVEEHLGLSGEEILYVGDHLSTDVHVSKAVLRWRTGLVVRELEDELTALAAFNDRERDLETLMAEKERLEHLHAHARLGLQRLKGGGPRVGLSPSRLHEALTDLRTALDALDARIGPLAAGAGGIGNRRWGPLMRAGNDKSLLARQVERYADVYTSRVSNFLHHTPYGYLRSFRGAMPHDPGSGSTPLHPTES